MFGCLATASWPTVDGAWCRLCMVGVVVAPAVAALVRLTNDAYNGPDHRTRLTQIVLNSLHNYGMDIPYHDTWWMLVDSVRLKQVENSVQTKDCDQVMVWGEGADRQ